MWDKFLEIASRVSNPISLAALSAVFCCFLFWLARTSRNPHVTRMFVLVSILTAVIGLAPVLAITYLAARGVYHIRVQVIGLDGQLISDATVDSSVGGEIKKANASWELEISPQMLPQDRELTVRAWVQQDFVAGTTTIRLTKGYFENLLVQLKPLPSISVRGNVRDIRGKPVDGATVAVDGYSDLATTGKMGNFEIPAHKAAGQLVTVTAQKGQLYGRKTAPAGDGLEITVE